METSIKLVFLMLIIMANGEASDNLVNIVNDMKIEMNERLAFSEEKTQVELKKTQKELKNAQEEIMELNFKNIQLEGRMKLAEDKQETTEEQLMSMNHEMEREIKLLKSPPFFHACASHYEDLAITSQTISYTALLYSSTNIPGGALDINTGIVYSEYPGSYLVTWSLASSDSSGDKGIEIYLRKNAQNIKESQHVSVYSNTQGGVWDQGGRTMILHLERGDTLDLYCEDCSAIIFYTTFCVSLLDI